MNDKLVLVVVIILTLIFIGVFLKFKKFREWIYIIFGTTAIPFAFYSAFQGSFWFLDLSKFELVAFFLAGYLVSSNYKASSKNGSSLYQSTKRDLIFIGIPDFYITVTTFFLDLIAYKFTIQNINHDFNFFFSSTDNSTFSILSIIVPLLVRNIYLRLSIKKGHLDENTGGNSVSQSNSNKDKDDRAKSKSEEPGVSASVIPE